ncbi:MAG TPA: carboxylating nicotinate-nucleotide diphosphorylase [Terriglobia bacterium]|nr:carboxylating nicotinate-nucleotide diphosphorylase [Terriglobia bacterium]
MEQKSSGFAVHPPLLKQFLDEDLGAGDITTMATVPADRQACGRFVAKASMTLAGLEIAFEVFRLLDENLRTEVRQPDGSRLQPGDEPASVWADARALLSGERVALNLLQRLSGVATLTKKYVDAVAGTPAKILDTRKTTPGLRALEKYAVTVGGGTNHRQGLYDAILIKENHIHMAGGVRQAIAAARSNQGGARFLEVEVTTLEELKEAVALAPDIILLDNMTPFETRKAVEMARAQTNSILLEASGGITLENVRQYAEAGVDWISIGALTHSVPASDLSFEIEPVPL